MLNLLNKYIRLCNSNKNRKRIEYILNLPKIPTYLDDEIVFQQLQEEYIPLPEYGYDVYSTWKRGIGRAESVMNQIEMLQKPDKRILEASCGDGMTGFAFNNYGHKVTLVDIEDWRDSRAKHLEFKLVNLCKELSYETETYDFIYSYNSFEHYEDPPNAFKEMIRVCKKGGYIYLEFGPLYASPWGLHAYRTLFMPYPQYIFSKEFILGKLDKLGIYDLGREKTELQPLNKWRINQYNELWENSSCSIVSYELKTDDNYLKLINRFPSSFHGRQLSYEDVTTQAITVLLRKYG